MNKTTFYISKMDCPSEEQLIRMKFEGLDQIRSLKFDLANRKLMVIHTGNYKEISDRLESLHLGSSLEAISFADSLEPEENQNLVKKILWWVLIINFSFFIIETAAGFFSGSMGLIADSLDMLADSFVYGMSLFVVGKMSHKKKMVARISGFFQMFLAATGFAEVIRRFFGTEEVPDFQTMVIISSMALIGNAVCLFLLQKSKNSEAHMQASMIFTSNDVLANLGVILAGGLVYLTGSKYPDLLIGTLVFILVGYGSTRILKLAK